MEPRVVPDGHHLRYTSDGFVMLGKMSRLVTARCAECSHDVPLRLCADEPISQEECDDVLTSYLESEGWDCHDDDVCPTCVDNERSGS